MAEKEYIERENIYTIAKKICDAVHSGEYGECTLPHSRIMLPHFILDLIDDLPAADVRPVVLCGVCELHGHCYTEDVFAFARFAEENRFCAAGKVKTNGVKREES